MREPTNSGGPIATGDTALEPLAPSSSIDTSTTGSVTAQKPPHGSTTATTHDTTHAPATWPWWALLNNTPPSPGLAATLCSATWLLWAATLAVGSVALFHLPPWHYAAFIAAMFTATAIIPDPGDCVWPTLAHPSIAVLVAKGLEAGGAWTFALAYWAFVLVPLLDVVVGVDTYNRTAGDYRAMRARVTFRIATNIFPFFQVALLLWAFIQVSTRQLTFAEQLGFTISVGTYTGGFGIMLAHELLHRDTWLEPRLGRIILALLCYGHFNVEHNRGHHLAVATPPDPATARYGESFWAFLRRCVPGALSNAMALERHRLQAQGLAWHHSEVLRLGAASAAVATAVAAWFGGAALALFLGQALMGGLLFESVNYLEHYGLERREVAPGRYESVTAEHSWDAPLRLTSMILFRLQRHADHHLAAGKRYQLLLAHEEAPQLPTGYPGSIVIAMVPWAWFRVMNPRVMALRARYPGRQWRCGPSVGAGDGGGAVKSKAL